MTKKIFIILVFVLALFSIQKTYAMTISDKVEIKTKEELENAIETNQDGVWEDLKISKYNDSNEIIYKLGNNADTSNSITISEQIQDDAIITILANGYHKKSIQEIDVDNKNDAYIATKIALDCVKNNISQENVSLYYRVKENQDEQSRLRAEKIIKAVENLLGISRENYFDENLSIMQVGRLEQDEFNQDYCSQKYEIKTENCTVNDYSISDYQDFVCDAFSTNNQGDIKERFNMKEDTNIFRIALPKEYREVAFNGYFNLKLEFQTDIAFSATDGNNEYIILTNAPKSRSLKTMLFNKRSSINIKTMDQEKTYKYIGNVKIKVQDENNLVNDTYTTNEYGMAFVTSLGKGNVKMEVLEIPENYTIEQSIYNKNLDYDEYCEYMIGLKYKKGSLHINNNLDGSIFEIYDNNSDSIGIYQTDQEGKIDIEEINIGENYTLRQIIVPSGYKVADDMKFSIFHNQVTTIDVLNQEEIKEQPDDDMVQDTNERTEDQEQSKNDDLGGNFKEEEQDNVGGAIKIPQREENKNKEKNEQTDEKNHQEEIEKNDENSKVENDDNLKNDDVENESDTEDKQNAGTIEKDDNNQNTTNTVPSEEDKTMNKLPRTGYDFPEINPVHIIFVILILLYILKRTAMSQSIKSRE